MTLVALLVSTAAVAQIPTLPWNPDENGDQYIGLPDLLGLLTVYGQEFQNAIVAEEGESAIMYMGDMGLIDCGYVCENLPGFWTLPNLFDLAPVLSDIGNANVWLNDFSSEEVTLNNSYEYLHPRYRGSTSKVQFTIDTWDDSYQCYCTAKQLPRVEYSFCLTTDDTYNDLNATGSGATVFQSCCDDKIENGWYPLGGLSKGDVNDVGQAFWRFAQ